ncbi:amino acid ABC transporter ATP-binding protein [Pectobacterium zantedeschiae]|nr:amino acid ABC transporter ATP-binding protein [Pectobacterium zantedeschiae]
MMLFDEPISALNPERVGEKLQDIKKLAHSGIAMVIATHEIGFARESADDMVFIENGRMVETGTARQMPDDSQNGRAQAIFSNGAVTTRV